MNDKENQIREMAEIIEKRRLEANITAGSFNEGAGMWYARDLYKEGYRKQSDTAREILQRLYDSTKNHYGNRIILTSDNIKELAAQYGVEVEE